MVNSFTVFVCSTFTDLTAEREAVLDAIRRLQLQYDSMEFFGARAGQPIETCLEEVRQSDILVVIVGHRYGTIASSLGISFSEAEYSEGYRLDKPCLVYVRDENVPILPRFMERDPEKLRLLERWKATLNERHTVAVFQESQDLAVQVDADLGRTIRTLEETARVRDEARSQEDVGFRNELNSIVEEALQQGVRESSLLSAIRRAISSVRAAEGGQGPTVFLSYSNADRQIVRDVASRLDNAGINVWFDESQIRPGMNFVNEIERGLDSADFIAFFISPNSVSSEWVRREIDLATYRQISGERGAVILPIILSDVEVPPLLRTIQWLDLRDGDVNRCVQRILEAIEYHTRRRRSREQN